MDCIDVSLECQIGNEMVALGFPTADVWIAARHMISRDICIYLRALLIYDQ